MDYILILLYSLLSFFWLYATHAFYKMILIKRINLEISYIFNITFVLVGISTHYFAFTPLLNSIISLLTLFIVSFSYQSSLTKRFACSVCWFVINFLIELLVVGVFYIITSSAQFEISKIIILVLNGIKLILIVLLLKTVKRTEFSRNNYDNLKNWLTIAVIPIASILLIHIMIESFILGDLSSSVFLSVVIIVIFVNIYFFLLLDRVSNSEKIKIENQDYLNQRKYYLEIEKNAIEIFEKSKKLNHDIKNHLIYINSIDIEEKDKALESVKSTIESLIGEIELNNLKSYTKNKRLNAFLNYKLQKIDDSGRIKVRVMTNINKNDLIEDLDYYIILGNLIDNAIENYDYNSGVDMVIELFLMDENLLTRITNPFSNLIKIIDGLPQTTKENKKAHGIGLRSVKKIIGNRNWHFNYNYENSTFVVEVILYDV